MTRSLATLGSLEARETVTVEAGVEVGRGSVLTLASGEKATVLGGNVACGWAKVRVEGRVCARTVTLRRA